MKGTSSYSDHERVGRVNMSSYSDQQVGVIMSSYSYAAPILKGKTTHDEPFRTVTQHKYQLGAVNVNATALSMDTIFYSLCPRTVDASLK